MRLRPDQTPAPTHHKTQLNQVHEVLEHLAQHGSLADCVLQGIDLRGYESALTHAQVEGAVLLGCSLSAEEALSLTSNGAVVFPDLRPGRPYHPTRSALYTLQELMHGFEASKPGSFSRTADYEIYQYFQRFRKLSPMPVMEALAQRLHDHAVDDALEELLHGTVRTRRTRRIVGIMGGHSAQRGDADYREVVTIAWELTRRGYFVATGGGPGAMEAGNLGAWLSTYDKSSLERAITILSQAPRYEDHEYLLAGYEVLREFPRGGESLAIPTWFYGHEPTNQFSVHIAKYFSNSLREDGLLAIATHGVVYAPGSAGTVQEVFMDAAQNHYGTFGVVSPMVLLGRNRWSQYHPVLPLLEKLAGDRAYRQMITAVDDASAVVRFIESHPPRAYAKATA